MVTLRCKGRVNRMVLSDYVRTFGQDLLRRYGERVHKVAVNGAFTCPNRDGSKGVGGCTFCNNQSFSPNERAGVPIQNQLAAGRSVILRRTGARILLPYFQAYTNTYRPVTELNQLYRAALAEQDVIGLAIGTRPDCVPEPVLDLLAEYQEEGYEIWLELGLQSAFDRTLERVNRGHCFEEYCVAVRSARRRGLRVCTHLILGLPGESEAHCRTTLESVLALGVDGLKLHPLHIVKGTQLARAWRRGEYRTWTLARYAEAAADLVARTPGEIVFHRLTGTAARALLLAPDWCLQRWPALNAIERALALRGGQGTSCAEAGESYA